MRFLYIPAGSTGVVSALDYLKINRVIAPQRIQTDNGSEFISKEMDRWAYENNLTLDYSRAGKPTENPFVESFNGSFRDECLNAHWFLSLEDATEKIERRREEYNCYRPHSSLNDLTPAEFIEQCQGNMRKNKNLPVAPASEMMLFDAENIDKPGQEKASFQMQANERFKGPESLISPVQ